MLFKRSLINISVLVVAMSCTLHSACQPFDSDIELKDIFLARISQDWIDELEEKEQSRSYQLSSIKGVFAIENNCLILPNTTPPSTIVVLEPTAKIIRRGGEIYVQMSKGSNPVRIGQNFEAGGGFTTSMPRNLEATPPSKCRSDKYIILHSLEPIKENQDENE